MSVLYIGNSNTVTVQRARDEDGNYLNGSASVSVTLVDSAGTNVSGQTWPLTLSYVSGSDGNFEGNLSASLVLTESYKYPLRITITNSGVTGYKELVLTATVREC